MVIKRGQLNGCATQYVIPRHEETLELTHARGWKRAHRSSSRDSRPYQVRARHVGIGARQQQPVKHQKSTCRLRAPENLYGTPIKEEGFDLARGARCADRHGTPTAAILMCLSAALERYSHASGFSDAADAANNLIAEAVNRLDSVNRARVLAGDATWKWIWIWIWIWNRAEGCKCVSAIPAGFSKDLPNGDLTAVRLRIAEA